MSWIFRKIFRFGPIRTTLSKGGVGMSWGIPGFRIGVSPTGRKYLSIGIPGIGLYFLKYLSGEKSSPNDKKKTIQQPTTIQSNQKQVPWWEQKDL